MGITKLRLAKTLTPIVDRNGKRTSVWRNHSAHSPSDRIPASAPKTVPVSRVNITDALLLPRNPHVRVITNNDNSKSLYIEARSVVGAITFDAEHDLSYKLPVNELMEISGVSQEHKDNVARWETTGDLIERHFAFLEATDKQSLAELIEPLTSDEKRSKELRVSFFDPRKKGEKVVINGDGSIAGYLYHFRDSSPITLEEIRPDLMDTEDAKETEGYLAAYQNYEDGSDSSIRDDYLDDVVEHIRMYGHPKAGVSRITFFAGDVVIKFPTNSAGIMASGNENRHGNIEPMEEFGDAVIASNEMRYTATGMPYIVMEKVDTEIGDVELPSWAEFVDGEQIGRNMKGELVAYDL